MIERFLEHLTLVKKYSSHTIKSYQLDLKQFQGFLVSEGLDTNLLSVKHNRIIRTYVAYLQTKGLKASSIHRKMSALHMFYAYFVDQGLISNNILDDLSLPKKAKQLPKRLHDDDIINLLNILDLTIDQDLRDYLMLDILFSCGLRASEMVSLTLYDIDMDRMNFRVTGKGNKTRFVPFTETIKTHLKTYITHVRPKILSKYPTRSHTLFLSRLGHQMTVRNLQKTMNRIVEKSQETYHIHPHMLRHAFASTMLNHGADLRTVQSLLGHEHVSTTQIYTHLSSEHVKKAFNQAHPRSKKESE